MSSFRVFLNFYKLCRKFYRFINFISHFNLIIKYQALAMYSWMVEQSYFNYSPYSELKQRIDQLKILLEKHIRQQIPFPSQNLRFSTKNLQNHTVQLTLDILLPYKNLFQVFTQITINFEPNFNFLICVQYTIDSSIPFITQKFKYLNQTITYLENLKSSSNLHFSFSIKKCIKMHKKAHFGQLNFIHSNFYANYISEKILFPFSICAMVTDQLEKISQQTSSKTNIAIKKQEGQHFKKHKSLQKILKGPQILNLIQQEKEGFRQYFTREGVKGGLLRTVSQAEESLKNKKKQVTVSIRMKQKQAVKGKDKIEGGFSTLQLMQCEFICYETIGPGRRDADNKWQTQIQEYLREQRVHPKLLMCKRFPEKIQTQKRYKGALQSFRNQCKYLVEAGGSNSIFVNKYYFQLSQLGPKSDADIRQIQIYSDYHELSAWKFFDPDTTKFTMSDIVNLAEQVMTGLIEFYLSKGFLHRDVKEQNFLIAIKQGIAKFIDHASVYPFDLPFNLTVAGNSFDPHQMETKRKQYHSTLRSTLFVDRAIFNQHRHTFLNNSFPNYTAYRTIANTHPTFDVYSLGKMLQKILKDYSNQDNLQWMQVTNRWQQLIHRMINLNPLERIPMDEALKQVKEIRKFIFGTPENLTQQIFK